MNYVALGPLTVINDLCYCVAAVHEFEGRRAVCSIPPDGTSLLYFCEYYQLVIIIKFLTRAD